MNRIIMFFMVVSLFACTNSNINKVYVKDSPEQGIISISVDESFKPAIEEQLKIYKVNFPDAVINVQYKSEADCFKDFQKDSARLIVVSRGLTNNEREYYNATLAFKPQYAQVAYDAVAAIININNKDSVFTLSDLKNILQGKKKYNVIVDGNNATSTVKFLQDSLIKGTKFGANVFAVNGSDSVIEMIKRTKDAIGFIGNSWVSNGYDEKQLKNLKQIKLALIECVNVPLKGYFAKASQSTLQNGQYPFARPVYYIVKENWLGLGTGFGNFLAGEKGQLIFRTSNMVASKMNFNKRLTKF